MAAPGWGNASGAHFPWRRAVFGVSTGTLLALLIWAGKTPTPVLRAIIGVSVIALGVVWAISVGRFAVHVGIRYFTLPKRGRKMTGRERALNFWMSVDLTYLVLWTWCTLHSYFFAWTPWGPPVVGVVCSVVVEFLANVVVDAAARAKKPRGTDWLRETRFYKWLVRVLDRSPDPNSRLTRLRAWLENPTEAAKHSGLVVVVVTALGVIGVAVAPVSYAAAERGWQHAHPRVDRPERHSAATPSPTLTPSPSPTLIRQPYYTEQCGHSVAPGDGAPNDMAREDLRALWLGNKDEHIAGAGAEEAGCAGLARRESSQPSDPTFGVIVAEGYCGQELRTLAVAAPGAPAVLLYQEAARIGLDLVERNRLLGASRRTAVGRGDGYLLDTPDGTAVLLRRSSARGTAEPIAPPTERPCDRQYERNVPYVELQPALAALWISEMAREGAWLWPAEGPRSSIIFGRTDGRAVGTGTCRADGTCWITTDKGVLGSPTGMRIKFEDLTAYLRTAT
jgi:hypothetical protein